MTAGRPPALALLLVAAALTCAGCASTGTSSAAAAPPPTAASPAAGSPAAGSPAAGSPTAAAPPAGATDLLGSSSATLDALRVAEARRPVSVLVPGVARPAPVQNRTTNPVTGGLDLAEDPTVVAWWASGAVPGAPAGSVVLAAHVSYDGQTGPFTRLSEVAVGTRVVVTSADGADHTYAVQSTRSAPKTSLDRAELFRTTGPPELVLVTCGGAYDRRTHTFASNILVTAVPV